MTVARSVSHKAAKSLLGKLFSFAIAGGTGFVVDIGVLWLGMRFAGLGPFSARALAIIAAMLTTYVINRMYTFGASGSRLHVESAKYGAVALLGAFLNYVVYSTLIFLFPQMQIKLPGIVVTAPFIATFVAVAIVTCFSWFGYSRFVFRK